MPRFFTSAVQFDEAASVGSAVIDGEDGRHIARSLRMHTGDALTLSDGAGTDYTGEIESITGDTVMVRLTDKFKNRSEPTLRVTLYPGMPKADKLELITQKAVELGVTKIVPVLTSRSVSRPDAKSVSKKQERLQRIALEAAKQSGRGIIPEIGKMTDLESALKTAPGKKILFYEGGGEALGTLVSPDEAEVSVFIGPEGGFDAAEVQLAKQYGATPATLGPRILRTETAPLAALSVLMYINGIEAYPVCGDLSDPAACERVWADTEKKLGHIDALVNAAGISLVDFFDTMTPAQWKTLCDTNLSSAVYLSQCASRSMIRQKSGAIVNVSSIWGVSGAAMEVAYSAAKAGMLGLTRALALELAPSNITVNAVAPGYIDTKMNAHLSEDEKKALCEEIPLGRAGTPAEVAAGVRFLAESPYITGETLVISGGWR